MCEKLDKLDELNASVKSHAEKAIEASHRACIAIIKSPDRVLKNALTPKIEAR